MPTLGALTRRPELDLRFAESADAARYGDRPVEAVVEGAWAAEGESARVDAMRNVLLLLPAANASPAAHDPSQAPAWGTADDVRRAGARLGELARGGVAGVVIAGCAGVPEELAAAARRSGVPLLTVPDGASQAWTRLFPVIRREEQRERRRYADEVKTMQRLVLEPDGLRRLLRWLARQISGSVALVGPGGTVLYAYPDLPEDVLTRARPDIERVVAKQTWSAAIDLAPRVAHIMSIGGEEPSAVLVLVRDEAFPAPLRGLVADAAGLVWLRWRVEELRARGRQVDQAVAHSREATLHLLMLGNIQGARRVTRALGARLPEITRVYIVECPAGQRPDYERTCADMTGGRAWIVRCPVYTRHLIVLAPAESEEADGPLDQALRSLAETRPGCYVGAGRVVALHDTAAGYEQAFHALAVARGTPARCATFSIREDITALLGPGGLPWALRKLRRLLEYRPERRQDPDADELTATLASWLAFYNGAAKQMKIHRNTLSARLRHIEGLLGCDLGDLRTQAEIQLALRLLEQAARHTSGEPEAVALDVLIDTPQARYWAEAHLSPLRDAEPQLLETLRAWLNSNARLDVTAEVLALSVPAARKRMLRVEAILARSLLNAPSARYDLILAVRILDGRAVPRRREIA
ncbi:hypothetical protein Misp01_08410 [Microtetraspora sp. NBRC 13810]|uniref:helix-turn-helix domain-containing protein n=1 Tax=Microtetraspora sp. NBRC 13810 TaxID=3030990 RepID=UPI0024A136E7|nr:helix-turn-helix domain-containing protein [Microtetraspora sp. NBRC 13810]GLW05711.1 hypothetical protein Misp01_08410 [Microtetraspora sp. NBRC 13810]